jgi:ferredoxin
VSEKRTILVCSCEDTMSLDTDAVQRGCKGASVETARYLCRDQLDQFRKATASRVPLTVACTQEAPLFSDVAGENAAISFVNVRETAGWSNEGAKAGPKMAALLAAAALPLPAVPFVSLNSEGVVLVYGRDEKAIEAADLLKDHLDVTVLITKADDIAPRRVTDFPVVKGTIKSASGHLGAFEIAVDDYATPAPSSRGRLIFSTPRNGAVSRCDLVLDLSGNASLFPAADLRDGYLRADPNDPAAVLRAVLKAREMVGTFDKPRYITFSENLCAHSRSQIVGCRRCLDLCPTGAISPAGEHVAIDPRICAGCGQCAAACPTGAAAYALPSAEALIGRLRTLLMTYREAGGLHPIVLMHDQGHGAELIDALARYGDGLPANTLPFAVNEVTQIGLETIAATFAYGASGLRFLQRARPKHDIVGLKQTIALAEPILAGLGFGAGRVSTIETDDPDVLGATLRENELQQQISEPATFTPAGNKRDVLRFALRELHRVSPAPVDVIALPAGAPFGTVDVNVEGCTLCLSCVSACPTGALRDDPERPTLRFAEDACVQCGLCKATCPEKVIALRPQIDFRSATASTRLIKEEEPFACIRCNKPFGTKSTVERVLARLEGKHWMYKGSAQRLDVIKMCEDCRVVVMSETDFDPYGAPRANPRTTDDYLRERERLKQEHERKSEG